MNVEILTDAPAARLARLAALHEAAFAPDDRGWSAAEIGALARNGRLFAAAENTGFALISLAADEAELLTIAVDPAHRKAGLGAKLVRAVLGEAASAGAARAHLDVAQDNAPARRLYEAAGFTQIGRRPRYYLRPDGRRCDAILYAAALGSAFASSRAAS